MSSPSRQHGERSLAVWWFSSERQVGMQGTPRARVIAMLLAWAQAHVHMHHLWNLERLVERDCGGCESLSRPFKSVTSKATIGGAKSSATSSVGVSRHPLPSVQGLGAHGSRVRVVGRDEEWRQGQGETWG